MIVVQPLALEEIKHQATVIYPDECCGFLFGSQEKDGTRLITRAREVINVKEGDKRRRFEISGKDYMQAEQFALENDILLLGIYHSHPNHPAIPSEHDRLAAQPFFSYLIISVMQGITDHIRSWRLNDEFQFAEEIFSTSLLNQSI